MRFTTSIALLGALAASTSAVAAADSAIDPAAIGTYPAFLAYQAKISEGTATNDDKAQLAALGKQLKASGVPMDKVVGTDTQGKSVLNIISQGPKAFASVAGAAVEALTSRGVRPDHEAPKPVSASAGSVPNFITLMNQVYGGDDSATTLASFVEAGLALLESGTSIDQLTKILGTENNGNDALAQILDNYGTEEKRDVVSDIVVSVDKLLSPPPAQAAAPTDNVSGFLFYASKFWANPASAGSSDPEGLAKFISMGQALQSQNPNSIRKLLGTSENGLALAKIVNSGAAKRGFRQHKRGGAAMAVEAGSF